MAFAPTPPAPGPYYHGMCLEELACMMPYRAEAVIAANQASGGLGGIFSGPAFATWLATLPTTPPAGGGWWNNGGSPTFS